MSSCWWKDRSVVTVPTGKPIIASFNASPAQQDSPFQNIPAPSSDAAISRFAPY
ncbi:hypothetical protein BDR03DRAFT_963113 [Suillus americanus]|nr:hypothetical protein BDR03DRAFT_963113 [Suillus americanus]